MTHVTLAELITMCSLASAPNPDHIHDTLHRIVLAHSGGLALTVLDATTSTAYAPTHPKEAAAIVAGLEASSHRVHVGLAGLSSPLRRRLFVEPEHALDPCTNIGLATLELERVLGRKDTPRDTDALHRTLATYFRPEKPDDLQAIDWGSRVLLVPHVSVRAQVDAPPDARVATVTFTLSGSAIFPDGGQPNPTPAPGNRDAQAPGEAAEAPKHEQEANEPEPTNAQGDP